MKKSLNWVTSIVPSNKVKIDIRFKSNKLSGSFSNNRRSKTESLLRSNYRHRWFTSRSRICSNRLRMNPIRISATKRNMAKRRGMKLTQTLEVVNKNQSSKVPIVSSRGAGTIMMTMSRRLKSRLTRQAMKTFSLRSKAATWVLKLIWKGRHLSNVWNRSSIVVKGRILAMHLNSPGLKII